MSSNPSTPNNTAEDHDSEAPPGVFVDPNDVLSVIDLDDEDLPDANELDVEEVDHSIHAFTGHEAPVHAVAFHPSNSQLVATGGEDETVYLWQVGVVDSHLNLRGHSDTVSCLEFSTDGSFLASGGFDGIVNIWDCSSGRLLHKLEGPSGSIEWLQWHPNGHLILAGSDDFTTWLWNADTETCMQVFSGHNGVVTCGGFSLDGRNICTGSEDGSLQIWDPRTGNSIHVVRGHQFHSDLLTFMSFSHDSSVVMVGSMDAKASIVNVHTRRVIGSLVGHLDAVLCGCFLSPLPFVATGGRDGRLIIWDLQGLLVRHVCQHEREVIQCKWSSTSQFIYSACADGKVRLWNYQTGACERVFKGHTDVIQSLAISNNGAIVLSGSDDCTACVFEL